MAEDSVAQDQIKAFVERILRLKAEVREINADVREIYAEAKGNGFDKTVLGKLVNYVEKRQSDATALAEADAIFDLYLTAYDSAAGKVGTVRATHTHASEAKVAALRADPAMSIVDVSTIKKPEPQSAPQTGSDLTAPEPIGQVAPNPEPHEPEAATSPAQMPSEDTVAVVTSPDRAEGIEDGQPVQVADKLVEAKASAAPAPKYADPGVIVWETTPPEGVERGAISTAFGTMGQDLDLIGIDMANASSAPIVKKGKLILDGWARFMKARAIGIEYPVVQYVGTDILTDIIKLNVEGRILSEDQKRKIAASLARQEPSRKDDIYRAFELWMEPA